MAEPGPWTTPSELAEYAFCPRAHFFGRHAEAPVTPAARAGERFHARRLGAERWRDEHRATPWLALFLGLALLALAAWAVVG